MTKDYGSTSNHEGSEQRRLAYRSRRGSSFMVYKTFLNEFTESNGGLLIVFLGFLTAIGIGCLIGVIPQVATQRYAETRFGYNDYDRLCNSFSSQTKPEACIRGAEYAQTIASYTAVARYMMALLSNSVAGSYSDRYGRRGFQILSLFLLTLPPVALLLVQGFQNVQPICFFAAESFSSVIHMLSIGFTQLSDVVAPNHRAAAYGLFYGSFMGGIAVAPFLSSLMSHIHVAVFSSFVRITALVIAMRYLPETLSRERRMKASEQKRDGCETANETESSVIVAFTALLLRPFREMAILGRNRTLVLLATAAFLSKMVSSADITLFFYYVENNLGVTDTDIAGMMFVAGLLGMLIQAVFLKDLISCTGERGLLLVSFCTGTVHNLMYGLAPGKSMLYCGLCLAQLSNTNNPLLSSQVSKYVAETEQGRIQGALFSLTSLAEAIGPLAFDLVSRNCRIIGPGTMFGFGAVLYGLGLVTILQLPHKNDNLNDQDNRVSEENALVTGRLVDF